jgi:hypothetical protein
MPKKKKKYLNLLKKTNNKTIQFTEGNKPRI